MTIIEWDAGKLILADQLQVRAYRKALILGVNRPILLLEDIGLQI
jgi:hypothetical protein